MGYPPAKTFTLHVLDPQTAALEQAFEMQGTQCVADVTPHPRYTALKVTPPDQACALWFYDWQSGERLEHGPVTALVRWDAGSGGFLVVQGTPPDDLRFEIARP
jgi:hypothetical protein